MLNEYPVLADLAAVLLSGRPLVDVRAPVEFAEGAFPSSHNLPLMNDVERTAVGTCYKQKGQAAAVALGRQLVSGAVKEERLAAWQQFVSQHPDAILYCFRGGLRSRISQDWLYQHTGTMIPRVAGGYKALRRFLLDSLEQSETWLQPWVLTGRTGAGKTRVLRTLSQSIDLEGLANHRGSAFGHQITPQPSQINFENALALALLRQQQAGHTGLIFEDESSNIGSVHIPDVIRLRIKQAPLLVLEVADEERLALTLQEYVVERHQAYIAQYTNEELAFQAFAAYLTQSLGKVQRRLGGVRFAAIAHAMQRALQLQQHGQGYSAHEAWIAPLLFEYYDPMYDYQLSTKSARIVWQGTAAELPLYLTSLGIN